MGFYTDTFPARVSAMSLPRFADPDLAAFKEMLPYAPAGAAAQELAADHADLLQQRAAGADRRRDAAEGDGRRGGRDQAAARLSAQARSRRRTPAGPLAERRALAEATPQCRLPLRAAGAPRAGGADRLSARLHDSAQLSRRFRPLCRDAQFRADRRRASDDARALEHDRLRRRLDRLPDLDRHRGRDRAQSALSRPRRSAVADAHSVDRAGDRRGDDLGLDVPLGVRDHQLRPVRNRPRRRAGRLADRPRAGPAGAHRGERLEDVSLRRRDGARRTPGHPGEPLRGGPRRRRDVSRRGPLRDACRSSSRSSPRSRCSS